MGGKKQPTQQNQLDVTELASVLQGLNDLLGEGKLTSLVGDVQELKYDNEKLIKPALKDIREILNRDVYASKTEVADLKKEIEDLKTELETEKKRTKNYEIVEKVVFGLVGIVLLSVATAIVALVVITGKGA